jgi:hypothetical protein
MKIASTARQLPGRKTKDEEYGRNEAFSNRRSSYTFDLPLADQWVGAHAQRLANADERHDIQPDVAALDLAKPPVRATEPAGQCRLREVQRQPTRPEPRDQSSVPRIVNGACLHRVPLV